VVDGWLYGRAEVRRYVARGIDALQVRGKGNEMTKQPKVGDKYIPCFQSDLDDEYFTRDLEPMKIAEVEHLCDDGETWSITAGDGQGYDAVWSDRHQVWCYNLG
jgi:hypothetical protein